MMRALDMKVNECHQKLAPASEHYSPLDSELARQLGVGNAWVGGWAGRATEAV